MTIATRVRRSPTNPQAWALTPVGYDERFPELAHQVPGMTWSKSDRSWVGYADAVSVLSERLVKEGVARLVGDGPTLVPSLSCQHPMLRAYQQVGLGFITTIASEGVMLADGMGLGKSRTALAAIEKLGDPAVVVCPNVVKSTWRDEGKKLGIDVTILSGTKPPDAASIHKGDGVFVVNYDVVHAWLPLLKGANVAVFDEAHHLGHGPTSEKDKGSRRSLACKELAHSSKHRIALSGTPYTTDTYKLWNVVDTISPGRFGRYWNWVRRYCNAYQKEIETRGGGKMKVWDVKGSSHLDELKERLKYFTLRRTKADVAIELPPMTRQLIEVDVPGSAAVDWTFSSQASVERALGFSARGKFSYAVELALAKYHEGSSVVVFVHQREVARDLGALFAEHGIQAYVATGEHSATKREAIAKEAAANAPSIMVVTTHSMGEGVNFLSFADVAIMCELDYAPYRLLQAEARLHRFGQLRNVHVLYLIGLGTIDERIRQRVIDRLSNFEQTLGSVGDSFSTDLQGGKTEADLLAELRDSL